MNIEHPKDDWSFPNDLPYSDWEIYFYGIHVSPIPERDDPGPIIRFLSKLIGMKWRKVNK